MLQRFISSHEQIRSYLGDSIFEQGGFYVTIILVRMSITGNVLFCLVIVYETTWHSLKIKYHVK